MPPGLSEILAFFIGVVVGRFFKQIIKILVKIRDSLREAQEQYEAYIRNVATKK